MQKHQSWTNVSPSTEKTEAQKKKKKKKKTKTVATQSVWECGRVFHILNSFYKIHSLFSTVFIYMRRILINLMALIKGKWKPDYGFPQVSNGYYRTKKISGEKSILNTYLPPPYTHTHTHTHTHTPHKHISLSKEVCLKT